MQVSLYVHLWQAVLMFVAGLVAVVCSFIGFLRTGGGEQLLRQALLSFLPTGGKAGFRELKFDLGRSKLTVYGLHHTDIAQGENRVSGLYADECEVLLDLWPHPEVAEVRVRGMPNLSLRVQPGFLQAEERAIPQGPRFPIRFEDVDCEAQIGDGPRLRLKGCGGEIHRGDRKELLGEFSLRELNGQPFNFHLACLADGRWELTGRDLDISTGTLRGREPRLWKETFDPLELLISSLLSGESEAKGKVSLGLSFRLAGGGQPFECTGLVAYRSLELRLPRLSKDGSIPHVLDRLLGRQKAFFPRWLLADAITTGPDGTVAFHMRGRRLEFACGEGPGSVITWKGGPEDASIEALKGSVETDSDMRVQRVTLRGFLGPHSSWEFGMHRGEQGTRVYDVILAPRARPYEKQAEDPGLWRFHFQVEDFAAHPKYGLPGGPPWLRFRADLNSQTSPDATWLPPGVHDFSGRFRVQGSLALAQDEAHAGKQLTLDQISWESGGLEYGGPQVSASHVLARKAYGPLLSALPYLWGGGASSWSLRDVAFKGGAVLRFDADFVWLRTEFNDWRLTSGKVLYRGIVTDQGEVGLAVKGEYGRDPQHRDISTCSFIVGPAKPPGGGEWSMKLGGVMKESGDGLLRFEERNIPLKIHPERTSIDSRFVSGPFDRRVSRKRELELKDGQPTLRFLPLE